MSENKMSETKRDYEVGRGKPPVHTRFKKGQSGNPRGPRPKNLPALLVEALNEKVVVTIDGERREITKREAVATQLVNKSTGADLRATKMLIDTLKDAEKKAGVAPPPEPAPFTAADEEVMATFIARLRQAWEDELRGRGGREGRDLDRGRRTVFRRLQWAPSRKCGYRPIPAFSPPSTDLFTDDGESTAAVLCV
jgi:hypothetical protein